MKSILIIEDEILVARSTSAILTNYGFSVVGLATNVKQAHNLLHQNKIDLILCDINLNEDKTGIDLMEEVKLRFQIPFIFISSYSDRHTLEKADKLNPQSYLTKPFSEKQLLASVNRVFVNQPSEEMKPTEKELMVLNLIAKGHNTKSIASILRISFNTVETHRKNLLRKYDVGSMTELICLATTNKWITYEASEH